MQGNTKLWPAGSLQHPESTPQYPADIHVPCSPPWPPPANHPLPHLVPQVLAEAQRVRLVHLALLDLDGAGGAAAQAAGVGQVVALLLSSPQNVPVAGGSGQHSRRHWCMGGGEWQGNPLAAAPRHTCVACHAQTACLHMHHMTASAPAIYCIPPTAAPSPAPPRLMPLRTCPPAPPPQTPRLCSCW